MDIETATASGIYRGLLDMQDRLLELAAEDRLSLEPNALPAHGTVRGAVDEVNAHLEQARQILAWLETRDGEDAGQA
ncbi:hypothetical protein LVY72_11090 [Arthrobacter sp. I2-34]|uniref:Uncharacterized protein n=1 Tax=Arthrobacter hankyongi TaxID=2904801 RepID=A0ABS9L7H8_9MICC|nr:hypothetical protein [Arthrobacter hankyongi]MCG2622458.1 hypothetical protein [Arthrobacter hankyongi]